jgi:hypothetical protein
LTSLELGVLNILTPGRCSTASAGLATATTPAGAAIAIPGLLGRNPERRKCSRYHCCVIELGSEESGTY